MLHSLKKIFRRNKTYRDIAPDEIFMDSQNLPEFNTSQFEGRIEKPISKNVFVVISVLFLFLTSGYIFKLWSLQIASGATYRNRSEINRLHTSLVFANRGVVYDRNQVPLAFNGLPEEGEEFSIRRYATSSGLSAVLGYVKYPAKDTSGVYYSQTFTAKDGIEKVYDADLSGKNGHKLVESDAKGHTTSESILEPPIDGKNVTLSIDLPLQKQMYDSMLEFSTRAGYKGGAGVIMNIDSGEIVAMASFPEYNSNIMTDGTDIDAISAYLSDTDNPFLNRAVSGIYTPGSVVKPFVAMGVLDKKLIGQYDNILSTGSISIPNQYDKSKPTVFKDWRPQGYVDIRHAIAVSSNVYFYEVGGGFQNQKGLGITNLEKYFRLFGLGEKTGIELGGELTGVLPNPAWKKKNFKGEDWRVGDTYNTSIGQYGVQVTPLQMVRAIGAVANGGSLVLPTILKQPETAAKIYTQLDLDPSYFKIVQEGMRLVVTEGTGHALAVPYVQIAAKTGTAELGTAKARVNSWVVGYFPYQKPKYAFALVMEKGYAHNQVGAALVAKNLFDWMNIYRGSYFGNSNHPPITTPVTSPETASSTDENVDVNFATTSATTTPELEIPPR